METGDIVHKMAVISGLYGEGWQSCMDLTIHSNIMCFYDTYTVTVLKGLNTLLSSAWINQRLWQEFT